MTIPFFQALALSSDIRKGHSHVVQSLPWLFQLSMTPGGLILFRKHADFKNKIWMMDVLTATRVVLLHFEFEVHCQLSVSIVRDPSAASDPNEYIFLLVLLSSLDMQEMMLSGVSSILKGCSFLGLMFAPF